MSKANMSGVPVTMHCSMAEMGDCSAKSVKGFQSHIGRPHRKCDKARRVHAKRGTRLAAVTHGGVNLDRGVWVSGPCPSDEATKASRSKS